MSEMGTPRGQARVAIALALAGGIGSTLLGNVVVNQWNGPTSFHHQRINVPDQDQVRVGLPNEGKCYCVPTSTMNVLMYVANHGYPQVTPGPGDYSGYDTYYDVTALLEKLGAQANISPGGDDPDDPDCLGDAEGSGGECSTLACGGSLQNVYNALLNEGWLGSAKDDLVFTARFLDENAPAVTFPNLAQLGLQGNVLVFCYGRYKPVGGTPNGETIYKRSGGHCVTMNEAYASGADRWLFSRDPSQDDDDVFGPSPYVSNQYDVTDESIFVTEDPAGGQLLNWWPKTLPGLNEPYGDGKKRLVDGYLAVKPKTGTFWKNLVAIEMLNLGFQIGTGIGDPDPFPTLAWNINDAVPDQDNIGWFVLKGGTEVSFPQLLHVNPVSGDATAIAITAATRLALGRLSDLYEIEPNLGVVRRRDLSGTLLASVQVPGPPSAIAYDDATDRVFVLIPATSGFGGSIVEFPRALESEVEPVVVRPIEPTLMVGGATRLSFNPVDNRLWLSSESGGKASGVEVNAAGQYMEVESVGGFPALTGIDFDDSGRLYAVNGGNVKTFERDDATGAWNGVPSGAFAGVEVGPVVRLARSRSNWNPAFHDEPAWVNIDTDELLDIGTPVPDCLGDLNGDGTVDGADLGLLLAAWNGTGIADLDNNGVVNGADLGLLLAAWGPCGR
ncbi:MAG: dockerin type I repeat-containing protein [Phycisphaerales bacterium]|nr:dockerin type I repeat-containing protein [Phycisphaerales bacterium]